MAAPLAGRAAPATIAHDAAAGMAAPPRGRAATDPAVGPAVAMG